MTLAHDEIPEKRHWRAAMLKTRTPRFGFFRWSWAELICPRQLACVLRIIFRRFIEHALPFGPHINGVEGNR